MLKGHLNGSQLTVTKHTVFLVLFYVSDSLNLCRCILIHRKIMGYTERKENTTGKCFPCGDVFLNYFDE